jgi:hypothetical protein
MEIDFDQDGWQFVAVRCRLFTLFVGPAMPFESSGIMARLA